MLRFVYRTVSDQLILLRWQGERRAWLMLACWIEHVLELAYLINEGRGTLRV